MPKGLVALERTFDEHENLKTYKPITIQEEIENVNLGNEHSLKEFLLVRN